MGLQTHLDVPFHTLIFTIQGVHSQEKSVKKYFVNVRELSGNFDSFMNCKRYQI